MMETTKKAGFEVYESPLEVRYVPTSSELKKCLNIGRSIAQKMKSH